MLNLTEFYNLHGEPGRIAIDMRGWLWAPLLGGSGVIELNPFSRSVGRYIPIPANQVGACTFGGRNWETLYVSTIRYEFKEPHKQAPHGDEGGFIYAIHGLGVTGVPTREYSLREDVLREASALLHAHSLRRSPDRERPRSGGSHGFGSGIPAGKPPPYDKVGSICTVRGLGVRDFREYLTSWLNPYSPN
ncbi:uncharacterized protein LOC117175966 [Belonocnema kinseyi]|uniref:uncharacterized protein LOC117175966 n=1 Tax=Belonocnema kinseyi TaxID=2817044 RepID=UPI00143DD4E1|nr:uncharacterized protein LOC117175966 [Belonocnema kinseyi]